MRSSNSRMISDDGNCVNIRGSAGQVQYTSPWIESSIHLGSFPDDRYCVDVVVDIDFQTDSHAGPAAEAIVPSDWLVVLRNIENLSSLLDGELNTPFVHRIDQFV